ncbi:MAG: hypothetical protein ABW065_03090 [Solirubrobacterales bacterium]
MAETKSKKSRTKKRASGAAKKVKSKAGASDSGSNGSGSIVESVKHGAKDAINGTGPVLQKLKVPLVAGGAAAAGIAGAVLASRSGGKKKVLGVPMPKHSKLSLPKKNGLTPDARKVTKAVTDAAKRADDFGQGVSRIASSVKKVGEAADDAVKKG